MTTSIQEVCFWPHHACRVYAPFLKKVVAESISSLGGTERQVELERLIKETIEKGTAEGRQFVYELMCEKGSYTTMSVYSKIKVVDIAVSSVADRGCKRDSGKLLSASSRKSFKFTMCGGEKHTSISMTIEAVDL